MRQFAVCRFSAAEQDGQWITYALVLSQTWVYFLQGLRASVVFVRQEKANKFKLNANTVIHARVALTVFFHLCCTVLRSKYHSERSNSAKTCILWRKVERNQSTFYRSSKNLSVFTKYLLCFPCRVRLKGKERNFLLYRASIFFLGPFFSTFVEWSSLSTLRWWRHWSCFYFYS